MQIYNVCLFGHRQINDLRRIDDRLEAIVRELIKTKEYVVFYIGRNGEFDEYAASVIKRVQREYGKENSELTLVLPYRSLISIIMRNITIVLRYLTLFVAVTRNPRYPEETAG